MSSAGAAAQQIAATVIAETSEDLDADQDAYDDASAVASQSSTSSAATSASGGSKLPSQQRVRRARWTTQSKRDEPFRLTDTFLAKYAERTPPFGFHGLGEVVYLRTYSRIKDELTGEKERWYGDHEPRGVR